MQLAFDIASKEIGIPDLLDVEDVCDVAKPDERSLMTYIAYWFHAFSQMERVENAGRRVEKFVTNMQGAWEMQNSFERRMRELLRQITAQRKQWDEAVFEGTYADVKEQLNFFNRYKKAQKRSWVAEKSDLAALLGNIKTKMSTYRLRPYEPPADLSLEVLDRAWLELTQHERKRSQVINETIRDIKNTLRRTFAEKANSFANTLSTLSLACSSLDGDIDDQLAHIKRLHKSLPPLSTYLSSILLIHEKCEEANIEENDYTTYTYDELLYEHTLVVNGVAKKLAFLENQLVARDMTNLTPVQLEEFESVFRHFDRSGLNSLNEVEFSAALASLGLVYDEVEMHSKFLETVKSSKSGSNETNAISTNSRGASPTHGFSAGLGGITSPPHTPNHNRTRSMIPSTPSISHNGMNNSNVNSTTTAGRVSFEGFIRFMVGVTEDQNTAEQVFQSFREVADGKEWVTEVDLRHSLIPDELIEELVKGMPELEIGNGDGNGGRGEKDGSARGGESDGGERKYDYVTFMERMVAGGGSGSGSGGGSGSVQVRDEKENVNGGSSGIGNSWIGR
ncbi:hypothetical protein MMC25_000615 [Agyrium rufum]|nr:hypothetical protein [Agyrium rufum]